MFNFDGFDLIISITSAEAKNIITKPETCHVCYCLTPTRYLWSGYIDYVNNPGLGKSSIMSGFFLKFLVKTLRKWDLIASRRPDYYLAISGVVKKRIEKYYRRQVDSVIYPPVDLTMFSGEISNSGAAENKYFLTKDALIKGGSKANEKLLYKPKKIN